MAKFWDDEYEMELEVCDLCGNGPLSLSEEKEGFCECCKSGHSWKWMQESRFRAEGFYCGRCLAKG